MLFAEWRLIHTKAADACVNMAIDEATLILVAEGHVPPTVRIYYWDAPCYTVGYFQHVVATHHRVHGELMCVRRLTGGRACLHGGDLSYSVVVALSDTLVPSGVLASFEHVAYGVIEGLRLLGVDARYVPPTEIQVGEHVIGTAAQTRREGVLLHQGTVALKPCEVEEEPALACQVLTPLTDLIGGDIDMGDAGETLGMGFRRALGVDLSPSILFAKEKRLARQLLRDKYRRPEWNLAH